MPTELRVFDDAFVDKGMWSTYKLVLSSLIRCFAVAKVIERWRNYIDRTPTGLKAYIAKLVSDHLLPRIHNVETERLLAFVNVPLLSDCGHPGAFETIKPVCQSITRFT